MPIWEEMTWDTHESEGIHSAYSVPDKWSTVDEISSLQRFVHTDLQWARRNVGKGSCWVGDSGVYNTVNYQTHRMCCSGMVDDTSTQLRGLVDITVATIQTIRINSHGTRSIPYAICLSVCRQQQRLPHAPLVFCMLHTLANRVLWSRACKILFLCVQRTQWFLYQSALCNGDILNDRHGTVHPKPWWISQLRQ